MMAPQPRAFHRSVPTSTAWKYLLLVIKGMAVPPIFLMKVLTTPLLCESIATQIPYTTTQLRKWGR